MRASGSGKLRRRIVRCRTRPAGSVVLGGGAGIGGHRKTQIIDATASINGPLATGVQDWEVLVDNNDTFGSASFEAYAICATPSGDNS